MLVVKPLFLSPDPPEGNNVRGISPPLGLCMAETPPEPCFATVAWALVSLMAGRRSAGRCLCPPEGNAIN